MKCLPAYAGNWNEPCTARATLPVRKAGPLRGAAPPPRMSPFEVTRQESCSSGAEVAARAARSNNRLESMRLYIMEPGGVWGNANHLHRGRYGQIESNNEGLRFGTLVRLGQAEEHPVVCARYPVIRDTLMLTSSRQMRNMATIGGSLLQRNRYRGMPRKSRSCSATRSSDLAQALIALGATVDTIGASSGPRRSELAALHCKSGETEDVAAALQPGELITFINIPAGPWTRRSRYVKILDSQLHPFALASAAVALHMEGNKVRQAHVALG